MPYRREPLITDSIYHIYNRAFNKQTIFLEKNDYNRAFNTLNLYQHKVAIKYSYFKVHGEKTRKKIIEAGVPLIEIIAYCLMPNHFHLLVKQVADQGIAIAMGKFLTSYAKYFNTKRNKIGPVFGSRFQAVLIESNKQLLHVCRYIHLNPYSASLIKKNELIDYPYSSISECLTRKKKSITNPKIILDQFKSRQEYLDFVMDNADYQQYLQRIKKQLLDGEE